MEIGNEFIVGYGLDYDQLGRSLKGYLRRDGIMALKIDPALFDGGRRLPLVEDFYTIQGEGFHAGNPPTLSGWADVMSAAAGAMPSIRGIRRSILRPTCRP